MWNAVTSARTSVIVVATLTAGVLLAALSHASWSTEAVFLGITLADLGTALGEGLIVAGILAALVDRRLKKELASELAGRTSQATAEVFFREF